MPDLGNLSMSSSLTLTRCPTLKPNSSPPTPPDPTPTITTTATNQSDATTTATAPVNCEQVANVWEEGLCSGSSIRVLKKGRGDRGKKGYNSKSWDDFVRVRIQKKMDSGVPQSRCFLPFLVGAKKMAECLFCHRFVNTGEAMSCSVRNCQGIYHTTCIKEGLRVSNPRKFKCPQHACFNCKGKFHWRCVRCPIASHNECAPWSDEVIHLKNRPGRAVCWRHPPNWRHDKKQVDEVPETDIEGIFCRLPLPYNCEEFKIDLTWKDLTENKLEPPPYVHIRRNVYLVKKKRDDDDGDVGCTNCSSTCCEDCVCRVQCISCSRACRCPETCTNRPFRKEKRIKIVKTEFCGWGVKAAELINKGDFIIEYIGEVIDDKLCEQRLWDMKYKGVKNFYMCEIRKDFTIDATFKGNSSRFLNHSCHPNCILEKWQVEGETRVGVFAARSIKIGEPLTYDYRFVQFGPEVKCYCGAPNCQGYLGTKRKVAKLSLCWGAKRRRTSTSCVAIITL